MNKHFLFYSKFNCCHWRRKPFCRNTVHVDSQDAKQRQKAPAAAAAALGRTCSRGCRADMSVGRTEPVRHPLI